jgi:hypothetical protein
MLDQLQKDLQHCQAALPIWRRFREGLRDASLDRTELAEVELGAHAWLASTLKTDRTAPVLLLQWTDALNDHAAQRGGATRRRHDLFFGDPGALMDEATQQGWNTVIMWAPRAGHLFTTLQENVAHLRRRLPHLTVWLLGSAPWAPASSSGAARASLWGRGHAWLRQGAVAEIIFLREPVAAVIGDDKATVREGPMAVARLGPAEGPPLLRVESWLATSLPTHTDTGIIVECNAETTQQVQAWLRTLTIPGLDCWALPLPAQGVPGRSRFFGMMAASTEHARHTALRQVASHVDGSLGTRGAILWCSTDIWNAAEALLASTTSPAAVADAAPLWVQAVMTSPKQALLLTTATRDAWVLHMDSQAASEDKISQLNQRPLLTSGSQWARPRGLRPAERMQLYGTTSAEADLMVLARVEVGLDTGVEELLQALTLRWAQSCRHQWEWVRDEIPPAGGASWATRGRRSPTHEILLHAPSTAIRDLLIQAIRDTAVTDANGIRRVAAAIPTTSAPPPGGGRRGRGAGAPARRR